MLDRTVPKRPLRGPHTKEARNAKPTKADPLPTGHPERVDAHTARIVCTTLEFDIVRRRNHGTHWEKIAQDTGYALTTVKRMHRTAEAKVTQYALPRRAPDQAKPGYVYFLRSGDHVKIGYAVDVAARMRELQCGNPVGLHLLGVIAADPADERTLHLRFSETREQGEWFRHTPVLAEFIEASAIRKVSRPRPAVKKKPAKVKRERPIPAMPEHHLSILRARQADPPMSWSEIATEHGLSRGVVRRICGEAQRKIAGI